MALGADRGEPRRRARAPRDARARREIRRGDAENRVADDNKSAFGGRRDTQTLLVPEPAPVVVVAAALFRAEPALAVVQPPAHVPVDERVDAAALGFGRRVGARRAETEEVRRAREVRRGAPVPRLEVHQHAEPVSLAVVPARHETVVVRQAQKRRAATGLRQRAKRLRGFRARRRVCRRVVEQHAPQQRHQAALLCRRHASRAARQSADGVAEVRANARVDSERRTRPRALGSFTRAPRVRFRARVSPCRERRETRKPPKREKRARRWRGVAETRIVVSRIAFQRAVAPRATRGEVRLHDYLPHQRVVRGVVPALVRQADEARAGRPVDAQRLGGGGVIHAARHLPRRRRRAVRP